MAAFHFELHNCFPEFSQRIFSMKRARSHCGGQALKGVKYLWI